jgi:hypothetical protein
MTFRHICESWSIFWIGGLFQSNVNKRLRLNLVPSPLHPTYIYIYIILVKLMHAIQDRNIMLLVMYNQSNAIICIKCRVHIILF